MLVLTDELLLNYIRCARRAYLNLYGDRSQAEPEKAFVQKLRRENQQQIFSVRQDHPTQVVRYPRGDWQTGYHNTLSLMEQGVERIERGVLWLAPPWQLPDFSVVQSSNSSSSQLSQSTLVSRPTILVRCPEPSRWGNWSYYPVNIKLGKRPKTEYKLIATFQAFLLTQIQGCLPTDPLLLLREGKEHRVNCAHWQTQLWTTLMDCLAALAQSQAPDVFISRQRCSLCSWQTACQTVARETQHLSLVPGITPSRYGALGELGITELVQLATVELPPEQLPESLTPSVWQRLQQQARSLFHQEPIPLPHAQPTIPQGPIELYFDLEAEPERQVDFLFGVLCINHVQQTEQFYALVAQEPEQEFLIWQQFLALVDRYPQAPIYHFSPYESDTLRRMSRRYGLANRSIQSLLQRCVDIHALIVQSATLPVESYSLKAIAQWLRFTWRDQGLSGDQTVCLYDEWLESGDRTKLETIIRYNEDDCRATYKLKAWLVEFWQSQTAG
ncbi:MAG: TM0106 family RecB-like putative nuclease [Spirulina sp. SIO3F2]|nr:TM0106 family RecB-like putative nuclease [Spirulina sp. SIO3F2]